MRKPTRAELEERIAALEAHEMLSSYRHNTTPETSVWGGLWANGAVTVTMHHYRGPLWPGGNGGVVEILISADVPCASCGNYAAAHRATRCTAIYTKSKPSYSVEVHAYTTLRDKLNEGSYRAPWRHALANLIETRLAPDLTHRSNPTDHCDCPRCADARVA